MIVELRELFQEIKHGDQEHQDWLENKIEDFIKRKQNNNMLTFSQALVHLKTGIKMQRVGWNGKGMYITLKPGYPNGIACNKATAEAHSIPEGTTIVYCPYLEMKTADNKLVPWLASQTDILAEDWQTATL